MKKFSGILWGIVLITAGLAIALDVIGIININYFFLLDGWWTLIIIVPSVISLVSNGPRTGNLIGLCTGILLLLGTRGIVDTDTAWKLIIPIIIVVIGVMLIAKAFKKPKTDKTSDKSFKDMSANGCEDYTSTFSGQTLNFSGEIMKSCTMNAIFGGIKCDMTEAIVENDIIIEACAVFGGIDLIIPEGVNVKVKSTSVFGGISNNRKQSGTDGLPTIYIKGTCMFGGITIK